MRAECEQFAGRLADLCNCNDDDISLEMANKFRSKFRLPPLTTEDVPDRSLSHGPRSGTSVRNGRRTISRNVVDRRKYLKEVTACVHRKEELREDVSNLCGSRGDKITIFRCDGGHKECSIVRYCSSQTPHVCLGCNEREVPIGPPFPQEPGKNPFSFKKDSKTPDFITTSQLMEDVKTLASKIPPETSGIIGIARSGLSVATMVSMLLHLPLSIARQSHCDILPAGNGWRLSGNIGGSGPPVVIDDTVMSGNSFKHMMPIVWKEFPTAISAAVYVNPNARLKPDIWVRDLPWPHYLEWNMFNSIMTTSLAVDFDGILCNDCHPWQDDDGEKYRDFLYNAIPKYPIRRVHIPMIVTARLGKYRKETEDWLARHGMATNQLIMGPWENNRERARHNVADYKAKHFKEFLKTRRHIKPSVFVESEPWQAQRIAEVSGGIVICPAAGRCYP